jgi:hypothetical protein
VERRIKIYLSCYERTYEENKFDIEKIVPVCPNKFSYVSFGSIFPRRCLAPGAQG